MKKYLTLRNILILLILIMLTVAWVSFRDRGFAMYEKYKQFDTLKEENARLKEDVESKQKVIDNNYTIIENLNKDRASLSKKIAETRAKRIAIKNPQDVDEITSRLKQLGIDVQVIEIPMVTK